MVFWIRLSESNDPEIVPGQPMPEMQIWPLKPVSVAILILYFRSRVTWCATEDIGILQPGPENRVVAVEIVSISLTIQNAFLLSVSMAIFAFLASDDPMHTRENIGIW